MSEGVEVRLFGGVTAIVDGQAVDLGARKQRAVLAILALNAGRIVSVAQLTDALWGDEPPESSRNALQVYVAGLRRALAPRGGALETTGAGYCLALDPAAVDALRFERLVTGEGSDDGRSREISDALAIAEGELLVDVADLPFAVAASTHLGGLRRNAGEERLELELEAGDATGVIPEIEAQLTREPYRERLWRLLMLGLYRDGRQADALSAFQRARRILGRDLGLEPGPALVALQHGILVQDPALDAPTPATLTLPRVPLPATPTLGRERDLARSLDLLRSGRLVTITGPGGVGKTRLALEVARAADVSCPDGCLFVDLAAARDAATLGTLLARAVGVDSAEDGIGAAASALMGRSVLVVLDNLEQVAGASDAVARLLAETDRARVLVTSRLVLRLSGERIHELEPLDQTAAVALFLARGNDAAPGLGHGGAVESLARQIVSRVEGLPLAVELAASNCRVMSAADVLSRLSTGGELPAYDVDRPARQRSLAAVVAWSLELLSVAQQSLLLSVSTFEVPFQSTDVELVTGESTEPVVGLAHLVDASLVRHDGGRYRVLEPIREVVIANAAEGERATARERHAKWALDVVQRGSHELYHGDEAATRARLRERLPDLRAAIDDLLSAGRADEAAHLVVDIAQVWFHDGRVREAEALLGSILAVGRLTAAVRAEATALRGVFAKMLGEDERAQELLESGVAALRTARPDSIAIVNTLCHLAALRADQGRNAEAIALSDEAVAAARRTGDGGSVAMSLDLAGYVARSAGDQPRAVAASRAAVAEARTGETFQLANALAGLAASLAEAGDPEAASVAWEASATAQAGGQVAQIAEVSMVAGDALAATDPEQAATLLAAALATWLAFGARPSALQALVALARVVEPAQPAEAAELLGAVARRNRGVVPDELTALEARLRGELGPRVFGEARAAGGRLDDDSLGRLAAGLAPRVVEAPDEFAKPEAPA